MSLTKSLPVVFTAQSKVFFYCRDAVCEYVFQNDAIPINPFRVFEYFLGDRVERDLVRQGNNNLIRIVDELWVFGEKIADGVWAEIFLAKKLDKPIKFFTIDNLAENIKEIQPDELRFETEVYKMAGTRRRLDLVARIAGSDLDQLNLFSDREKK